VRDVPDVRLSTSNAAPGPFVSVDEAINAAVAPVGAIVANAVFMSIPAGGTRLPLILVWLIAAGVTCTVAFRFINVRGFTHALRVVRGDYSRKGDSGETSPFQALSTAVAGTVGLGSIAGVAVAIQLGGPGAAFWMMLAGFLGMSTKFAEVTLAVKYRRINADGSVSGGPMYYITALFSRKRAPVLGRVLAISFCIFAIGGSFSIFQINQSFAQFKLVTGFDNGFAYGLIVALWVGIILFGGMPRIAAWTEKLVPLKCGLYIVGCIVVLVANAALLPDAIALMVRSAFAPNAVEGGVIGVMIQGFRRAAFACEAGLGSAPMAHATVRTKEPMSQGFAALLEPFLDVICICTLTALVIVVTGAYQIEGVSGVAMTSAAFGTVVWWFPYVLAACVIVFALSTILGWGYYGERAWTFVFGENKPSRYAYRLLLCGMLSIGATFQLDQVINLTDALNFSMAIPNLIAVFLFLPELRRDLESYSARHGLMPRRDKKASAVQS
jgi:alanine or glycine:cation symporter, AGCS family